MLQKDPEGRPSATELHSTRLPPLVEREEDPVVTQEEVGTLTTARWAESLQCGCGTSDLIAL